LNCLHDEAQQDIQDSGPRLTDFTAASPASMEDFKAMSFDLKKIFVASQFLTRSAALGQAQSPGGILFNFFQ
jgi:hypothetical protein